MATTIEVKYFNTFWLKKLQTVVAADPQPVAPYQTVPSAYPATGTPGSEMADWYIEEARIRGGYNNLTVDFGVKAYLDEEDPLQQHRFNSLIYSGIFNSRTGVNNTNQFSVAEDITKSADPANGSIQRLYAEDTNLIIFQEDKVSRALIDKDAIYSAEGNASITSSQLVIGQIIAYAGEYGIATDPSSFAVYGYRKYFTDRKRGAVLRLSRDGMTEISSYGMHDFFRDELAAVEKIVGAWDSHNKNYTISLQRPFNTGRVTQNGNDIVPIGNNVTLTLSIQNTDITPGMNIYKYTSAGQVVTTLYGRVVSVISSGNPSSFVCDIIVPVPGSESIIFRNDPVKTLSFDEGVLGWTSFFSYRPVFVDSLINNFYSFFQGKLYIHNTPATAANGYGNFYGFTNDSDVTVILNAQPSLVKNFKTINYEGVLGWELDSMIGSSGDQSLPINPFSTAFLNTLGGLENNIFALNFKRKENKFFANLQQPLSANTVAQFGEVVFGNDISGIKGFWSTVKFKLKNINFPTTKKELFSVSSDYVESSY